jgi:hypothetical protein
LTDPAFKGGCGIAPPLDSQPGALRVIVIRNRLKKTMRTKTVIFFKKTDLIDLKASWRGGNNPRREKNHQAKEHRHTKAFPNTFGFLDPDQRFLQTPILYFT